MAFEAGGKVATSTIDALKSQPLAIALILVNLVFVGGTGWLLSEVAKAVTADRAERNTMVNMLLTTCGEKILGELEELRLEIRGYIKPAKPSG